MPLDELEDERSRLFVFGEVMGVSREEVKLDRSVSFGRPHLAAFGVAPAQPRIVLGVNRKNGDVLRNANAALANRSADDVGLKFGTVISGGIGTALAMAEEEQVIPVHPGEIARLPGRVGDFLLAHFIDALVGCAGDSPVFFGLPR